MGTRSVLGKGLASLLPAAGARSTENANISSYSAPVFDSSVVNSSTGALLVDIQKIVVNPYQPRRSFDEAALKELSQSIEVSGIIQPLIVRQGDNGNYELIAGERRLRASKMAGLKQVPVTIKKSTDKESLEMALVENIQRQNLNCVDEALAYSQLMQEFGLTQEQVSLRVGKDRSSVGNFLRLLKLPEAILNNLKSGVLSFGHGKAILAAESMENRIEIQLSIQKQILDQKLSVRDTEKYIESLKQAALNSHPPVAAHQASGLKSALQERLKNLASDLMRTLGSKTEIKGSDRKGKIILHYANRQELEKLIQNLQK